MRIDHIRTPAELREVCEWLPLRPHIRDLRFYAKRFLASRSMYLVAREDDQIRGAVLATVSSGDASVSEYRMDIDLDDAEMREAFFGHLHRAADELGLRRLFTHEYGAQAHRAHEIGFSSVLFVQLQGESRDEVRRHLLREHAEGHRVTSTGEYDGYISNFGLAVDGPDDALAHRIESAAPCMAYSGYNMHRWIVRPEAEELRTLPIRYRAPRFIATFYPRFRRPAIREFSELDPEVTQVKPLDIGITLMRPGLPGREPAPAFRAQTPVWVRHLAPVQSVVEFGFREIADAAAAELNRHRTFAIQCRQRGRVEWSSRDAEVRVGMDLEGQGFRADLRSPRQIVSVFVEDGHAYVGVSKPGDNVSFHADEHRVKSLDGRRVSRAEHKLEEAIDAFQLALADTRRAIDLGAAPGGWSYVLAMRGIAVVSVDPAELAPRVRVLPNVRHERRRIEQLDFEDDAFDLVVNDMVMDHVDSARIMCRAARWAPIGVMTIKLPGRSPYRAIEETTRTLAPAWDVEAVRHLFHNRQEVTAFLRRKT